VQSGPILIGDENRALVVEGGTLVLVENPARIETGRRIVWLGGCCLAALAGIASGVIGVREWIALMREPSAQPWNSAIGASIAAAMLIASAVVGIVIVLRRKRVSITRNVLAALDPRTGLMRWEATGDSFTLDRVALRIRVLPDTRFDDGDWAARIVLAVPSLWIGPFTTTFPTLYAEVPARGPVLPANFDRLTPRLHAWGIDVRVENPSFF
jgi:hypothetical protein